MSNIHVLLFLSPPLSVLLFILFFCIVTIQKPFEIARQCIALQVDIYAIFYINIILENLFVEQH